MDYKIDFRYANLTGAKMIGADFSYTNFHSATLTNADLTNANLSRSDLRYSNLSGANFTVASLRNAELSYANLNFANLTGADLCRAKLTDATFHDAIGLVDLGCDLRRWRFYVQRQVVFGQSIAIVGAGCRRLPLSAAREHWAKRHLDNPELYEDIQGKLDRAERIIKAKNW